MMKLTEHKNVHLNYNNTNYFAFVNENTNM